MLLNFTVIMGIVMLAFVLLMLALKFSRYQGERHDDRCGSGCHCVGGSCGKSKTE
jgi:hypothetical protein